MSAAKSRSVPRPRPSGDNGHSDKRDHLRVPGSPAGYDWVGEVANWIVVHPKAGAVERVGLPRAREHSVRVVRRSRHARDEDAQVVCTYVCPVVGRSSTERRLRVHQDHVRGASFLLVKQVNVKDSGGNARLTAGWEPRVCVLEVRGARDTGICCDTARARLDGRVARRRDEERCTRRGLRVYEERLGVSIDEESGVSVVRHLEVEQGPTIPIEQCFRDPVRLVSTGRVVTARIAQVGDPDLPGPDLNEADILPQGTGNRRGPPTPTCLQDNVQDESGRRLVALQVRRIKEDDGSGPAERGIWRGRADARAECEYRVPGGPGRAHAVALHLLIG